MSPVAPSLLFGPLFLHQMDILGMQPVLPDEIVLPGLPGTELFLSRL